MHDEISVVHDMERHEALTTLSKQHKTRRGRKGEAAQTTGYKNAITKPK